MKIYLPLLLALFTLTLSAPLFAEEEQTDSGKLTEEAAVALCEKQITAEEYPNEEERNKQIDQCITDNTAAPASTD